MNWHDRDGPTRAVNIDADTPAVLAMCERKGVSISAVEPLPGGGTHVVLVTLDDADTIRHAFKGKLLPRNTRRTPFLRFRTM